MKLYIKAKIPKVYFKELVELLFFEFYTKIVFIEKGLGVSRNRICLFTFKVISADVNPLYQGEK